MENDVNVEALVVKSGETCIQTTLSRHPDGLKVNVWTHPRVEDFVRSLGSGEHIDIQTIGRYWSRPNIRDEKGKMIPDERRLMVYFLEQSLGTLSVDTEFSYCLDKPGYPLVNGSDSPPGEGDPAPRGYKSLGSGRETLNISFLRLVGVSDGPGVSFTVRGVYSREAINRLGERIKQATNRFYREFLKPYKLIVTVSTMPIPGDY